jgi:hypothetical protein
VEAVMNTPSITAALVTDPVFTTGVRVLGVALGIALGLFVLDTCHEIARREHGGPPTGIDPADRVRRADGPGPPFHPAP